MVLGLVVGLLLMPGTTYCWTGSGPQTEKGSTTTYATLAEELMGRQQARQVALGDKFEAFVEVLSQHREFQEKEDAQLSATWRLIVDEAYRANQTMAAAKAQAHQVLHDIMIRLTESLQDAQKSVAADALPEANSTLTV